MAGLIIFLFLLIQAEAPLHLLYAILVHEAAHILTALLFTRELPFLAVNAAGLKLSYIGLTKCSERVCVSAAGPFFSLMFGLIFHQMRIFSLYSLSLCFINLLPVSVLDGGGIIRALTEKLLLPQAAYAVCRTISIVTTLLFFTVNCAVQLKYGTNISLAVISIFLTVTVLGKDM